MAELPRRSNRARTAAELAIAALEAIAQENSGPGGAPLSAPTSLRRRDENYVRDYAHAAALRARRLLDRTAQDA